jgi:hypothetical protein
VSPVCRFETGDEDIMTKSIAALSNPAQATLPIARSAVAAERWRFSSQKPWGDEAARYVQQSVTEFGAANEEG